MSLVELGRYNHSIEADLDRLLLHEHAIEAVVFDGEANNFFGGAPLIPVRLMVIEEDLDEARRILGEFNPAADAPPAPG